MMKALLKKLKKFLKIFSLSENVLRFIGGGEVLPKPYTSAEEAEMVEKLTLGEKDVRDKLVEHRYNPDLSSSNAAHTPRHPIPIISSPDEDNPPSA